MGTFGDKFRKERERRGFTLDEVSNVTKINARMLKAIEDEHFDQLPGGVFNKGFVRAYAKHLGLNDEESVTEYLAALRQAQIDAETAAWQAESPVQRRSDAIPANKTNGEKIRVELKPAARTVKVIQNKSVEEVRTAPPKPEPLPTQKSDSAPVQAPTAPQKYPAADLKLGPASPRSDSIPWRVPAVVLAVIVVAAILWNRHSRGVQADAANTPHPLQPSVAAAANPAATVPLSSAVARVATPSSNSSGPASNTPSSPERAADRQSSPSAPAAAPTSKANDGPNLSATQPDQADHKAPSREPSPGKLSVAAPTAKAPQAFTLTIRAAQTSWIAVSADGQPTIHETLIAPAATAIRASREITVRVGNAAGVSFLINGKEVPPQGGEAEIKTLTFDRTGLREGPSTP